MWNFCDLRVIFVTFYAFVKNTRTHCSRVSAAAEDCFSVLRLLLNLIGKIGVICTLLSQIFRVPHLKAELKERARKLVSPRLFLKKKIHKFFFLIFREQRTLKAA